MGSGARGDAWSMFHLHTLRVGGSPGLMERATAYGARELLPLSPGREYRLAFRLRSNRKTSGRLSS